MTATYVATVPIGSLGLLTIMRLAARNGQARALRETAGASQLELGGDCKVSAAAVSRWESGDRIPRGEAAVRYALALRELATRVGEIEDPGLRALRDALLEF